MKTQFQRIALLLFFSAGLFRPAAFAQGTAFTYQGRLTASGAPADGQFDFQFALFPDSFNTNNQVDTTISATLGVTNGLFKADLNFPLAAASFDGSNRWLQIWVRPSLVGSNYVALAPRQQITAAPYAITAGKLTGSVTVSQLPAGVVTNNGTGLSLAGTFSGNGAGLTNLNAWRLGGNADTTPGANFIGTTDNQPVEFRANGSRVLRLVPDLTSPNLIAGSPANDVSGGIGAAVLGGGNTSYPNRALNNYATVVGGISNTASGSASVAMGQFNTASGYAAVASGYGSSAGGFSSFAAGNTARAAHDGAFVWGDNTFADFASTANNQFLIRAAGGVGINTNNPNGAALAVSGDMTMNGNATVNGGMTVTGNFKGGSAANIISNGVVGALIGGGGDSFFPNKVGGDFATVIGGRDNTASGFMSTAMGSGTKAIGSRSIAMGSGSVADGDYSLAMGNGSSASGFSATAIGAGNRASGNYATAIGADTTASGYAALALGQFSRASSNNTFVWADGSAITPFASTGDNQFIIRATGGVAINTNDPSGATLNVNGFIRAGHPFTEGFEVVGPAAGYALLDRTTGAAGRWSMYANNGLLRFYGSNADRMTVTSAGAVSALSFTPTSDRNAKENFRAVDSLAVLGKVMTLPITTWNFKAAPGEAHIGPMAQDFKAAFGTGTDDKHIATVDADGVALAAIQGLNEKVEVRDQKSEDRMQKLEAQNADLKARLEKLERILGANKGGGQ